MYKFVITCWFITLIHSNPAFAENAPSRSSINTDKSCPSEHSLVVVRAGELPVLLGTPIRNITLWHVHNQQLIPIPSQIDRRDDQGRYLLDDQSPDIIDQADPLSADDEIVFRLNDAGPPKPDASRPDWPEIHAEIQVNTAGEQSRWVYATVAATEQEAISTPGLVDYQVQSDTVLTDQYRIMFNNERPFLIEEFSWRLTDEPGYSPNVLDSMKIQHIGTMFGLVSFERNANDYSSELTQVKVGPLRTIRRTENRVRIFWYVKTPTVYIDYIMMPDSFVMDTIIDIPFKLGLFFDQVETLTTIDWRNEPSLPALTISSPDMTAKLLINGQMSAEKDHFNSINGTRFSVQSKLGTASLRLDIPADFPIKPWLYLNDDSSTPSPPEHQPGQFGNVGYRTTGWENIDTQVHHLKFTTCLSSGASGHAP